MLVNWIENISRHLPFCPTVGQRVVMDVFNQFMNDTDRSAVMILRGSAGTGKTSVARSIVKALVEWQGMTAGRQGKVILMAPTGRAAKVFSSGLEDIKDAKGKAISAFTIHRKIYRQKSTNSDGGTFSLGDNLYKDMLFIVDESSMITLSSDNIFGNGNLLDDLVKYVYGGNNCRMMLIGDTAQLPPVGYDEAPALMDDIISGYGLNVYSYDLNEVLRQSQDSGILYNATMLRNMITYDDMTELPKIRYQGFADIKIVPGNELIEQLSSSYYHAGVDETIVVTRSNKRANVYNFGIRGQILDREEELCRGDHVMIVKNNYFWTMPQETPTEGFSGPSFLANGDRCVVQRVRNVRELYGFSFADVTIILPDYDSYEMDVTAILDTLKSESPALTHEQQVKLYEQVMEDYFDIPHKADKHKKLREDVYFNALQIKYAYAVTCHKAQGGQWSDVYVDQGYMTDDMLTPAYIHWLYTAFTRATEHLYLVNWPATQVDNRKDI